MATLYCGSCSRKTQSDNLLCESPLQELHNCAVPILMALKLTWRRKCWHSGTVEHETKWQLGVILVGSGSRAMKASQQTRAGTKGEDLQLDYTGTVLEDVMAMPGLVVRRPHKHQKPKLARRRGELQIASDGGE
ncbi:hypothetical protein NDU88_005547 [Pleurodeles waltl]|uniref:Uncharacterized protein n=1 Tax=Pleurodeles waltl TaxID=8319 RepID=A0AAV7LMZ2_PLEWA|nr:hypothetical protein NDU88_005547 [Pleurodeles waltl]